MSRARAGDVTDWNWSRATRPRNHPNKEEEEEETYFLGLLDGDELFDDSRRTGARFQRLQADDEDLDVGAFGGQAGDGDGDVNAVGSAGHGDGGRAAAAGTIATGAGRRRQHGAQELGRQGFVAGHSTRDGLAVLLFHQRHPQLLLAQ